MTASEKAVGTAHMAAAAVRCCSFSSGAPLAPLSNDGVAANDGDDTSCATSNGSGTAW